MSDGDLVLGIDAGTAGLRAGLFDLQGHPLGFHDQPYETLYPRPAGRSSVPTTGGAHSSVRWEVVSPPPDRMRSV